MAETVTLEEVVTMGILVFPVHRALRVQVEVEAVVDKVFLDRRDTPALEANQDLMANKDLTVHPAFKERLAHRESRVYRVQQANPAFPVKPAVRAKPVQWEYKVLLVKLVHKDFPVMRVKLESLANLDDRGRRVPLAKLAVQDHLVQWVLLVPMGRTVKPANQARTVLTV